MGRLSGAACDRCNEEMIQGLKPQAVTPALEAGAARASFAGSGVEEGAEMSTPSKAVIPLAVEVDMELKERLDRLGDSQNRSTFWMMREAIQQYVEREERRAALRRDVLKAWSEYQESGLHLTGDEVVAWVDSWGGDGEQTAHVCHK